jgi:hypothetical protein
MASPSAEFRTKYRLYTLALPAILTTAAVFACGWLTFHPPETERRQLIEVVAGSALLLLCAGSFEFLSRWGFNLLGLGSRRVSPDEQAKQRLKEILRHEPDLRRTFRAVVVDLGDLPLVLAPWQSHDLLWISSAALSRFTTERLRLLAGAELLRNRAEGMLDRVLVCGGFWWAVVLAVMLLLGNFAVAFGWFIVAGAVFVLIIGRRSAAVEARADRQAADSFGLQEYAAALAGYLSAGPAPDAARTPGQRLTSLGLSPSEADELLNSSG